MAKINVIRNTYGGLEYLQRALNYVTDTRAMYGNGFGVNPYNTSNAYDPMLAVKRYYGKTSGNPLVHIVIAYDDSVKDINTAAYYGYKGARFFADCFQVLYCTHEKDFHCGHFHTHIIINSVSYVNGQMLQTGYDEMNSYCNFITKLTGQKSWFYFDNKAVY